MNRQDLDRVERMGEPEPGYPGVSSPEGLGRQPFAETGLANQGERGSLTVELAILLPLLLLIVAAIIDLGLLFWEQAVLTNAAREGARAATKAADQGFGAAAELTQTQVRQVVQNYLANFALKDPSGQNLVLDGSNFSYTWTATGSSINLTVVLNQVPHRLMLLPTARSIFGGSGGDGLVYLSSRTTMAAEWTTPPGL